MATGLLVVSPPANALVVAGRQQVSVGAPPVTGITGAATPTVPSSAPTSLTAPTSTPVVSVAPSSAKSSPTTKARKIVRRKTVPGAATTIAVSTTIVLDVSLPAVGPPGVGAGAALDPNSSAPVPVGDPTQPSTIDLAIPTTTLVPVVDQPTTVTESTTIKPGAASSSVPIAAKAPSNPGELRELVISALANAGGRRSAAISVGGQMVVDVNAGAPRLPASTQKIYVGAAALSVFGPEHRFQTTVRSSSLSGDTVADLTLVGGGDPSFSAADLRDLAQQVRAAGIATVTGRISLDDSLFDRATTAPGWKAAFTPGEVGYLNAFLVDGNHRNDAATVNDAGLANLARFVAELAKAGVFVGPTVEQGRSPGGQQLATVATNRSAPLLELVTYMLKKSENTYAETLLKQLGTTSGQGSTQSGVAAVVAYFGRLGVAPPITMVDGSGLSSLNRSTSGGQVAYLSKVSGSKVGESFRKALPVACLDGTLKSRMCGTPAARNVAAKTGSLNFVATLTGYATTASGRAVVFSILVNESSSAARSRLAMDKALAIVASYTG